MVPSEKSTRDTVPSTSFAVAFTVIVAGALNVAPDAGLVTETVGFWLPGLVDPVHATPLSEKAVGFGSLPLHVPLKPIWVDAPVPRLPFQDRLVPVTSWPVWDQVAPQP